MNSGDDHDRVLVGDAPPVLLVQVNMDNLCSAPGSNWCLI